MVSTIDRPLQLTYRDEFWCGTFDAMASTCEVLMAIPNEKQADEAQARVLLETAAQEAWRIEQKFSRYRDDGIVPGINNAGGARIEVDPETAQLLDFAYQCYDISDGLFDITSGLLRKAWSFDPDSRIPEQQLIDSLLPLIGLSRATWQKPYFTLPEGMQIDLGGIGKEYAVDRTLSLLLTRTNVPLLVNFGGDIACNRGRNNAKPWIIGIENPLSGDNDMLEMHGGGLATSGGTQRFLMHEGKRYSHVLNPFTGWPIDNPPSSITVAADTSTTAGMLATCAMLQGVDAEQFLIEQEVQHWVVR